MQYTLLLTTRMLTIAAVCLVLLCVLLFLLGMEIGKTLSAQNLPAPAPTVHSATVASPSKDNVSPTAAAKP